MATDIPLGLSKAFRWVPHKVCDIIGCNHNRITKPTKTQIRTHLQKVCVRIFQYGAKLATGPREANASACTTHEPAPKGMVQPPFRPIRLWRDLRSKMVHCTVFARRYARRRGPTGCGARIVRRPLGGPSPLRPRPRLRLPVSAAGGGRLRDGRRVGDHKQRGVRPGGADRRQRVQAVPVQRLPAPGGQQFVGPKTARRPGRQQNHVRHGWTCSAV